MSLIFRKKTFLTNAHISDLVILHDSLIVVTGAETYNYNNGFIFLKSLKDSIDFHQTGYDIATTDIKYDSFSTFEFDGCHTEILDGTRLTNASVEIVNHGNSIVNELLLISRKTTCYTFCIPIHLWNARLSDLNLMPGEKKWVHIGEVIIYNVSTDMDSICLIATQPDRHVDIRHPDNEICIIRTVGTNDRPNTNDQIVLFPNPANNILYFSSSTSLNDVSIYNLEGKLLLKYPDAKSSEFDVSVLNPGIYFLRGIMPDGKVGYQKFIKH